MIRLAVAALAGAAGTCAVLYAASGGWDGACWAFATTMSLLLALKGLEK